jgi:hypothetical protein
MARLDKREVETLMAALDTDLLQDALRMALRRVLDVEGFDGDWPALAKLAGERACWPQSQCAAIVAGEAHALVELALTLNELRTL